MNHIFDQFAALCIKSDKSVEDLLTIFGRQHPEKKEFILNNIVLFLEVGYAVREFE